MSLTNAIPILAGLVATAAGLALIAKPDAARRLNRPLGELLPDIRGSIRVERFFYRHHRVTGPVTVAGGGLLLLIGWMFWQEGAALHGTAGLPSPVVEALALIAVILGTGLTVIGAIVTGRPSALKRFEAWANRPVDRDMVVGILRRFRARLNALTAAHPRLAGALTAGIGAGLLFLGLR